MDTAEVENEACAGLTFEPASAAAVANPPTANPEPFKKVRLSTTFSEVLPMKDEAVSYTHLTLPTNREV